MAEFVAHETTKTEPRLVAPIEVKAFLLAGKQISRAILNFHCFI